MTDNLNVQLTLTVNAWNATNISAMAMVANGTPEAVESVGQNALDGVLTIAETLLHESESAIGLQDAARKLAQKFSKLADEIDEHIAKVNAEMNK